MINSDPILLELNEKWKVELPFGWIPIIGAIDIPNTEIYKADSFKSIIDNLKNILNSLFQLTSLYEIEEGGNVILQKIENCEFGYNGIEYLYTDSNYKIIIYFSHENSVAIGGSKLINEIHKTWPSFKNHYWKDSDLIEKSSYH